MEDSLFLVVIRMLKIVFLVGVHKSLWSGIV